jgi:hypothetical protein
MTHSKAVLLMAAIEMCNEEYGREEVYEWLIEVCDCMDGTKTHEWVDIICGVDLSFDNPADDDNCEEATDLRLERIHAAINEVKEALK